MIRSLVWCAVLALGLLSSGAALAHAVLLDSAPAAKARISGDGIEVNLHYNSRVDAKRSRLLLKGPGGEKPLEVRQGRTEADLAATLSGLAPGAYVLHWDVLSVDGHVSRGTVPFTMGGSR